MLCYAKSLQSCPTLCDPIDGSPPVSAVPGILQARTLQWVAISFSNAWKRKVKVKSLSRVWLLWPHGLQPTRLLHPWIFQARVLEWGAIAFSDLIYNSVIIWMTAFWSCKEYRSCMHHHRVTVFWTLSHVTIDLKAATLSFSTGDALWGKSTRPSLFVQEWQ